MDELLSLRIARWTGWAMGRALSWVNYIASELREVNMADCHKMDEQRFELIDEVSALETALKDAEAEIADLKKIKTHYDNHTELLRDVIKNNGWETEAGGASEKQAAGLREDLMNVLEIALERGTSLGYQDDDWREWLQALKETEHETNKDTTI